LLEHDVGVFLSKLGMGLFGHVGVNRVGKIIIIIVSGIIIIVIGIIIRKL